MLFVDPRLYWEIILLIIGLQIISIFAVGYFFRLSIRLRLRSSSNHRIFKQGEYTAIAQRIPERYCFVVVKYDASGAAVSETFYAILGDWSRFKYIEGAEPKISGLHISSFVLISPLMLGLTVTLMFNLRRILEIFEITPFPSKQGFFRFAQICFFVPFYATAVTLQVKALFDTFYVKDKLLIAPEEL